MLLYIVTHAWNHTQQNKELGLKAIHCSSLGQPCVRSVSLERGEKLLRPTESLTVAIAKTLIFSSIVVFCYGLACSLSIFSMIRE